MILNDQSIFLSAAAGAAMGLLAVIVQTVVSGKLGKNVFGKLLDFTLAVFICVVTFMLSIPLNSGRIRFTQVLLEGIGFASSVFVFGGPAKKIAAYIRKCLGKIGAVSRKIYKMRALKSEKQTNSQKNIKKRKIRLLY